MQTRNQLLQGSKPLAFGLLAYAALVLSAHLRAADNQQSLSGGGQQDVASPQSEEQQLPQAFQQPVINFEANLASDTEANSYFPTGNVLSPEQKVLLVKEQEIVNQVPPTTTVVTGTADHSAKEATKPVKPIVKVYNSAPYSQPKSFTPNPLLASGEVRLTYRPSVLDPLGEVPSVRPVIPAPDYSKAKKEPVAKKDQPEEKVAVAKVEPKKDEVPALTTFLEWVRTTDQAAEVARKEVEKKTQIVKSSGSSGMYENDLFLTIRFPYTGAEPPPNNASTVYSVPPVVR